MLADTMQRDHIPRDTDLMHAHDIASTTLHPFDARGIGKRFRHAAIFGALDALTPGEAMRFVNDHDPLPLLGQINERFGERVEIAYLQRDLGLIVIDFIVRA